MRALKPCGTPAAYTRHLRKGEEPCEPCRTANSNRIAGYYASPETGKAMKERNKAYQRALGRLAKRHRSEFKELYAEELAKRAEGTPEPEVAGE